MRGPRPLRSPEHVWGLPQLSVREYLQLRIGNLLLQCTWTLAIESLARCGAVVIDHPQCSREERMPSIWWLEIAHAMARHEQCSQFDLYQGPLGQVSPKPIRFHCNQLPTLRGHIHWLSTLSTASRTINQFDADGGLGTCKLKTYPPRLNGAIILGFVSSLP